MSVLLERGYRNGHAAIYVDGTYVELAFTDNNGDICELHCVMEGVTQLTQLSDLLAIAGEHDDFHPSQLSGWKPGVRHINTD